MCTFPTAPYFTELLHIYTSGSSFLVTYSPSSQLLVMTFSRGLPGLGHRTLLCNYISMCKPINVLEKGKENRNSLERVVRDWLSQQPKVPEQGLLIGITDCALAQVGLIYKLYCIFFNLSWCILCAKVKLRLRLRVEMALLSWLIYDDTIN